ncbi:MAG: polysaccharide biosynthesis protein [Fuerstiella sp.]|nr:polysaccharide biosynthesis protein [Fuerstiella sp.]
MKTVSERRRRFFEAVLRYVPLSIVLDPVLRFPLLLALHALLFLMIYGIAYTARFNFELTAGNWQRFGATVGPVIVVKIFVFYFGKHFHGWWRYVTFADLKSLLKVSALSMIVVSFVDYFLLPSQIPRLTVVLDTICTVLVIGGLRCTWRFADESIGIGRKVTCAALLVGTDRETGQLAAQINSSQSMPFRVEALLASAKDYRKKAILGGVPVLGDLDEVCEIARKASANIVLVRSGTLDGRVLRSLNEKCNSADIKLCVLPRFEDAMSGDEKIPLRNLDINDLLKRGPVKLDTTKVESLITGRRILITGAGGSIGSEICRQVMRFGPAELVLLGRGENRIYAIHCELEPKALEAGTVLHQEIGDITDERRMENLFEFRRPDIVFHAAAHKHVPLMELNPGEAIKTNVLGTKVVATQADRFGASHFLMVSSDKAVNPTSIMGATKQLAERVICDLAQTSNTKFATVRFGNVLGSAGSVIPRFQQQIRNGGPITITDERMTRYFMSIPEASQLVIQAAAMCRGGEIYVLDMGKPVRIVDLARDLVTLSGLPKESIEFEFTGIRPGEKLYEELYFSDEATLPTTHPRVRAAYPGAVMESNGISELTTFVAIADQKPDDVRLALAAMVASFQVPKSVVDRELLAKS